MQIDPFPKDGLLRHCNERARLLAAVLVSRPDWWTAAELLTVLYPEANVPRSAYNQLRQRIMDIRYALGDGAVLGWRRGSGRPHPAWRAGAALRALREQPASTMGNGP